jgi:hypothetical protein
MLPGTIVTLSCLTSKESMMSEFLWLLLVAAGPVLVGAVAAFVLLNRRRLTPHERSAQKRGTEKLYHERDASQPR